MEESLTSANNQGEPEYEVGYKKPPKEHQFKPGQSGNPAGKPEGTVSLTEAIKRRLKDLSPDNKRTALDWLADNIIQDALDSNNKMRQLIWNYVDGMPNQKVEVSGELPFQIIEIGKIEKQDGGTANTEKKD